MQLNANRLAVTRPAGFVPAMMVVLHTLSAHAAQAPDMSRLVAIVGDERIVEGDLERWWQKAEASTYERVRREAYDGRRRALDALLAERLLEMEAVKQGIASDELLAREVARRTKLVTEADVSAYLASNPMPAGTTVSMVAPLVATLLSRRAGDAARDEYIDSLMSRPDARVEVFLQPPRVSVVRALHNPTLGSPVAPVEVVVFSDFECPFCRNAEPALARLRERFPEEVVFVWKHFPLSIHQRARPAAEAAQCASDQGQFWSFHDHLFADPSLLQPSGLMATATMVGLDAQAFERCVSAGIHAPDVASDTAAGERAGVSGTPTVFINGMAFVGALPYETYERAVLDELMRLRRGSAVSPTREHPR